MEFQVDHPTSELIARGNNSAGDPIDKLFSPKALDKPSQGTERTLVKCAAGAGTWRSAKQLLVFFPEKEMNSILYRKRLFLFQVGIGNPR